MGNHKFRLSDMIPNAWFYKLKDMGRTRNQYTSHQKKKKQTPTTSSSSSLSSSAAINPPLHESKTKQPDLLSHQRKSYYFTRDLTPPPQSPKFSELPRKSSKQQRRNRATRNKASTCRPSTKLVTASVSAGCSCRTTLESVWNKPESTSDEYPDSPLDSSSDLESLLPELGSDRDPGLLADSFDAMVSLSTSCHCKIEDDIVINVNEKPLNSKFNGFDAMAEPELPPIITKKPAQFQETKPETKKTRNDSIDSTQLKRTSAEFEERNAHGSLTVKVVKEEGYDNGTTREQRAGPFRRLSVSSPGVRLRTNSPRIASRKIQALSRKSVSSSSSGRSRRSVSESFAIVKSSADPQTDFRESMVEMILENNLRGSKELEDLLACYLQLNSDEYHELIIRAFKQIWFDLAGVRLK